jgi:hypothetical protein
MDPAMLWAFRQAIQMRGAYHVAINLGKPFFKQIYIVIIEFFVK